MRTPLFFLSSFGEIEPYLDSPAAFFFRESFAAAVFFTAASRRFSDASIVFWLLTVFFSADAFFVTFFFFGVLTVFLTVSVNLSAVFFCFPTRLDTPDLSALFCCAL